MQRTKQQLSEAECAENLKQEPRSVASLFGDDGYLYGMPINITIVKKTANCILQRQTGQKRDAIKRCGKESFCVYDRVVKKDGEWALYIRSVIVFGCIRIVWDRDILCGIAARLSRVFTRDKVLFGCPMR